MANEIETAKKETKYALNKMFSYSLGKIRSAYDMYDS